MSEFVFSLRADSFLKEEGGSFFFIAARPPGMVRVNRSLYLLLKHIQEKQALEDWYRVHPDPDPPRVLHVLFSLVSRGYLNLEKIAVPDEFPSVSIIIPVRDQPVELIECLDSLRRLDYPREEMEIIVVDDGSRKEVAGLISSSDVKIIRHPETLGPAAGRNTGAAHASGGILAFLDADCLAGHTWLKELVPFFRVASVGAVGGWVGSYYQKSFLDRYEMVASPLNMGRHLVLEGQSDSTFYVPTANLLVTRACFRAIGGFDTSLRTGEDVDLCWRLRYRGYSLLYTPHGAIAHRHRHNIGRMLLRRAQYGMSEARLYRAHRTRKKTLAVPPMVWLSLLALTLAVLLLNPYPLAGIPLFVLADALLQSRTKKGALKALKIRFPLVPAARRHLAGSYYVFYHLVRYYLILISGIGFAWHPFWILAGVALALAAAVDFLRKRPALSFPVFIFFYLGENLAYQIGVFWGCLRQGYFGSYRLSFHR